MVWAKTLANTGRLLVLAAGIAIVPAAQAQFIIDGRLPSWGVPFEEVHVEMTQKLLDPRSAQYKGLQLVPLEGGNLLCGWMNWKGTDGGYGPFVAFYYRALKGNQRDGYVSGTNLVGEVTKEVTDAGCDPTLMLQTPGI